MSNNWNKITIGGRLGLVLLIILGLAIVILGGALIFLISQDWPSSHPLFNYVAGAIVAIFILFGIYPFFAAKTKPDRSYIIFFLLILLFIVFDFFAAGKFLSFVSLPDSPWFNDQIYNYTIDIVLVIMAYVFLFRKRETEPDWRQFFYWGLFFLAAGLILRDMILLIFGLSAVVISLINKSKWKEPQNLSPEEKKTQKSIIIFFVVLLLSALVVPLVIIFIFSWEPVIAPMIPSHYDLPNPPLLTEPETTPNEQNVADETGNEPEVPAAMTEAEARSIAEKTCIKGGESLLAGDYNENTKTWWFDANLNVVREGCNPACVVSEDTKTAEINWRCTGLILPDDDDTAAAITNFEECAAAGNPIMESYPRQCRANSQTFVEQIVPQVTLCSEESRNADVCIQIYDPVCATVEIQCIKAPCNPVKQTFSNSCEACRNPLVRSYTPGECTE